MIVLIIIKAEKAISLTFYLCSKIRFSAFTEELARDSDKTFNLSTYLYNQKNVNIADCRTQKELRIIRDKIGNSKTTH